MACMQQSYDIPLIGCVCRFVNQRYNYFLSHTKDYLPGNRKGQPSNFFLILKSTKVVRYCDEKKNNSSRKTCAGSNFIYCLRCKAQSCLQSFQSESLLCFCFFICFIFCIVVHVSGALARCSAHSVKALVRIAGTLLETLALQFLWQMMQMEFSIYLMRSLVP